MPTLALLLYFLSPCYLRLHALCLISASSGITFLLYSSPPMTLPVYFHVHPPLLVLTHPVHLPPAACHMIFHPVFKPICYVISPVLPLYPFSDRCSLHLEPLPPTKPIVSFGPPWPCYCSPTPARSLQVRVCCSWHPLPLHDRWKLHTTPLPL